MNGQNIFALKREICPEFGNKISPPTIMTLQSIGSLVQYIPTNFSPTISEYSESMCKKFG